MSEETASTSTSFGFKKRNIKKPAFRRKQESSNESGNTYYQHIIALFNKRFPSTK